MNKNEIGLNAGKVWQLLNDYTRWSYGSLKRTSGLKDKELGAALGWLAREDKIEIHQEEDVYEKLHKTFANKTLYKKFIDFRTSFFRAKFILSGEILSGMYGKSGVLLYLFGRIYFK